MKKWLICFSITFALKFILNSHLKPGYRANFPIFSFFFCKMNLYSVLFNLVIWAKCNGKCRLHEQKWSYRPIYCSRVNFFYNPGILNSANWSIQDFDIKFLYNHITICNMQSIHLQNSIRHISIHLYNLFETRTY